MGERFQECKQGADLAGKLLGKPCCDSGWYGVHVVYYLYGRGSSKDDHFDLSVLCVPRKYLSFYLYDKISGLMREQMARKVTEEQNRFYEYQVRMMKDTLDSIRMLRHDMKNKLSALYTMAQKGLDEEMIDHLEELTDVCNKTKEYAHSGNITIDSIINYKLQKAEEKRIKVTAGIIVPMELTVPTFDIVVVLGNLLDNAIEAVSYVEDRWIDIRAKYTKGRLIIEINNSYDGTLLRTSEGIVSRKEDKENHGMGIKSVEMTLEKYDGALQITQDGAKFTAKVLMYL